MMSVLVMQRSIASLSRRAARSRCTELQRVRIGHKLGRSMCRSFAAVARDPAVGQTRRAARWLLGGTAGLFGIAVCVDEGFRRTCDFWIIVLPKYLHYLYVDKVKHPESDVPASQQARAEAFEELHKRYSPEVERATLRLRGFYLKAAQIMSMREDFLPEIWLSWLRRLQNEAPCTLSSEEAKKVVINELGLKGGVEEIFQDWEDDPIGSASIGQVYRAKLRSTGELVAIKVQMPGVEHLFRTDIRTLIFFTSFALPWAVKNMIEIEKMFRSEFDYNIEHENLLRIRNNVLPRWSDRVRIPRPISEHCTRHVLCMEFLQGERLVDAVRRRMRAVAESEGRDFDEYEREHLEALRAGRSLARSAWRVRLQMVALSWWRWLRGRSKVGEEPVDLGGLMETLLSLHGEQVFKDGVFNGDPHPGNILLMEDGKTLGLIDFGQVKELPLEFRLILARLVIAIAKRDVTETCRLERALGMRTKYSKDAVRYRICSFWLDRDTDDVFTTPEGVRLNLGDFLAWGESQDPVVDYPDDIYMVSRCSVMIRSLALAFGVRLSTCQYWRPYAEALLRDAPS